MNTAKLNHQRLDRSDCELVTIVDVVQAGLIEPGRETAGAVASVDGLTGAFASWVYVRVNAQEHGGFVELHEPRYSFIERLSLEALPVASRNVGHQRVHWLFRCPVCGKRCRILLKPRRDIIAKWACRRCCGGKAPSAAKLIREAKKRTAKMMVRDAKWDALFKKLEAIKLPE